MGLRFKITDSARQWLLSEKGWNVRTVRYVGKSFYSGMVTVRHKHHEWAMGAGCLIGFPLDKNEFFP